VSRRGFRVAVDAPRPPSAWGMVTVASATLWITGQLDVWAIAVQTLALLVSLWRRTEPFRWQQNGWVLNAGMAAIVVGTVVVALRGEPSTIALAHFAALTQGLQLLDVRPRRTEFLLVALALFQVVLAANLTDSVFFTPLLLAFVFATVWTLMVHTLRSEAAEAGQAGELSQAFTPGLLRTTLLASALSVLLAMVLFVTLPRLRSQVVQGSRSGGALAASGFSDQVRFGELGRIRLDPGVVMRVETLEGEAPDPANAYWRGLAFDTFDGTSWSITPPERALVPGSAESGVSFTRTPQRFDLVQRIVREPVEAGVVFTVGEPRGIQGTIRRLERDVSGGLYAATQADERIRYTVRSDRSLPDPAALQGDRALPPRRRGERLVARAPVGPEIGALAREIVADAESDAAKARALERHLLLNGRYSDTPPQPGEPEPGVAPRTPIERFLLGDLAGHCEYFATAMVVLARELGLPSRLVNGFAGGRHNGIGGFVELTRADAHAWVEIHYAEAGWVRYDPTPPDLRARAAAPASLRERLRDLASAIELWWFQRVVGFDRSDQMGALKRAWLAWKDRNPDSPRHRADDGPGGSRAWREVLDQRGVLAWIAAAGAAALGLGLAWRRGLRGGAPDPHRAYARGLRLLRRRGLVRERGATARRFARESGAALPDGAARAFERLTEAYLAERFGGHRADSARALASLRRSLARRAAP